VLNILTVDVEEYFHATEVSTRLAGVDVRALPARVEDSTRHVLKILSKRRISASFFILGCVARRYPQLISEIASAGHEIGCHGYAHKLVYDLTPSEFKRDTLLACRAIEDACGILPRIYRAASYSITARSLWALEVLAECGFTHDSSIYPISHDRYGIPGFSRHAQVLPTPSGEIVEVPIATVTLPGNRIAPVGGGAYLRLFPYRYAAAGIRRINATERKPACIYFHPWELDIAQPRLALGTLSSIRTYAGIPGMARKIERLVSDFDFTTLTAVHPRPRQRETVMQSTSAY
jgi:polysaccharide deacetylase family protein (PEP-CTERM system associated)